MARPATPEELRSVLTAAAYAVVEGRITVQQANALSSLSSEVHKSLKMQYVGQLICDDLPNIENGRIVGLLAST